VTKDDPRLHVADLQKAPHEVAAMFDDVAERYDLTNDVLSLGQTRLWRRAVAKAVDARPGERVLDLAAGTAVSTVSLARSGAWCVAADFSLGMLRAGSARDVPKVAADALALPFADAAFDAVTISFGLRNVADPDAALAEMARVTRPGGRLVVCEFGTPTWTPYRAAYHDVVLKHALPAVARAVSSNPEAYLYLAESIRAWPAQPALAARIAAAGWTAVGWRNLAGGAVALHRATRP
jgi:demethylmenaquinone methyltransferase/2-methoxy-6-polyprenyl-1,4-benzoquinol methylase